MGGMELQSSTGCVCVSQAGQELTVLRRLPDDTWRDSDQAKKVLKEGFESDSKKEQYVAELHIWAKKRKV